MLSHSLFSELEVQNLGVARVKLPSEPAGRWGAVLPCRFQLLVIQDVPWLGQHNLNLSLSLCGCPPFVSVSKFSPSYIYMDTSHTGLG